jgi:hypothetical protein
MVCGYLCPTPPEPLRPETAVSHLVPARRLPPSREEHPAVISVLRQTRRKVAKSRRNRPVARIVPIRDSGQKRIGLLAGRPFRMGEGFDTAMSDALGDLFGVRETEKK